MRYDVRVLNDDDGRFEHEQDQPLAVGEIIPLTGIGYQVVSIQPLAVEESGDFDAIAEVKKVTGPTEVGYRE